MSGERAVERELTAVFRRRQRLLLAGVVACLLFLQFVLGGVLYSWTAAALTLGLYLVFVLPFFEQRAELELRTDESCVSVRDTFSSQRDPFTSLWISPADSVTEEGSTIKFKSSGLFGLYTREYTVSSVETATGRYLIRLQKGDSTVVSMQVATEPTPTGTRLLLAGRRSGLSLFRLVAVNLNKSRIQGYYQHHGFEIVEEDVSLRLKSSFQ